MTDFKMPKEKQIKWLEADILGEHELVISLCKFEEEVKEHGAKEFLKWLCKESSFTDIGTDGVIDENGKYIDIDDVIKKWRKSKNEQ